MSSDKQIQTIYPNMGPNMAVIYRIVVGHIDVQDAEDDANHDELHVNTECDHSVPEHLGARQAQQQQDGTKCSTLICMGQQDTQKTLTHGFRLARGHACVKLMMIGNFSRATCMNARLCRMPYLQARRRALFRRLTTCNQSAGKENNFVLKVLLLHEP